VASRIGTALSFGLLVSLAIVGAGGHAADLAADQSDAAPAAAADRQYQACLASADAVRDASRTAECKRLAEQTDSDRNTCLLKLNLPKSYCDVSYAPRDPTANCALPDEIGSVIDAELARARFRCARIMKGEEGKL
jgi:hypothetical protein